jgi:hypothetical protein
VIGEVPSSKFSVSSSRNTNPTNIYCHARLMVIEQIMALIGRGSNDPRRYRRYLESCEASTLNLTLEALTEGNGGNGESLLALLPPVQFPAPPEALESAEANSRVPDGEVQETREDHQNRSELPAREPIVKHNTLP